MANFDFDVVVKIGSMALIRKEDNDLDYNIFSRLASELKPGYILVSSGATEIGRIDYMQRNGGIELKGDIESIKASYASQGQPILMELYRRFIRPEYSMRQVLIEHSHFNNEQKVDHIRRLLFDAANQGAIPIVNYNDAVSDAENMRLELRDLREEGVDVVECTDNDETAAVITGLVHAKTLVILSSIDGIYVDYEDPSTVIEEVRGRTFEEVSDKIDDPHRSERGGGQVTLCKGSAAKRDDRNYCQCKIQPERHFGRQSQAHLSVRGGIMSRPANFRDLGGSIGADGKKVKLHRLLRSGELTGLSPADKKRITEEYGLKTIVDFRTLDEVEKGPDDKLPGTEYFHIDILENAEEQTPAMENILKMRDEREAIDFMMFVYETLVADAAAQRGYAEFIRKVMEPKEGALLFHCFAGKDRTGWAAAIVLTLLGVDARGVMADYMQTNAMHADTEQLVKKLERYGVPADKMGIVRAFMQTREGYLQRAFDTAERKFGSFREYAGEALHVTDEDIAALRVNYLAG